MTPARLALIADPAFGSYDFVPYRPFQEGPRWLATRLMIDSGLLDGPPDVVWESEVGPASRDELLRFHFEEYLDLVERLSGLKRPGLLDSGDTPAFPGCYPAAARIVGGALAALLAIEEGRAPRAFHPAGGLHHAHPGRASGFCIFNDVAIAIARSIATGGPFRRVAYVDIDAHHGDGVMYGFYENGRVLDIDFHQDGRTLFPGTGEVAETGRGDGAGLKVNVPLLPASGDRAFLGVFRRIVPPLLDEFRPDLIVLQHGVDGHIHDDRAGLSYTPEAYVRVVESLLAASERLCSGRLLVTGGGGYTPANVCRVFARAGFLLAGRTPPEGATPASWQAEYQTALREPAPIVWTDTGETGDEGVDDPQADRLVRRLGAALGRSFPRT